MATMFSMDRYHCTLLLSRTIIFSVPGGEVFSHIWAIKECALGRVGVGRVLGLDIKIRKSGPELRL